MVVVERFRARANARSVLALASAAAFSIPSLCGCPRSREGPGAGFERARLWLKGTGFSPYINNPINMRALQVAKKLFRERCLERARLWLKGTGISPYIKTQ